MRLLVIGLNFAPELVGVGKYTGEMASWLAARGHDVTVVTSHPYYPDEPPRGFERWGWRREHWRGCRVIRCPFYVPRRWTGVRRSVHLGSFALSSIPAAAIAALSRGVDAVGVVAPTVLSAPFGLALARTMRVPAWLHYQDFEIEAGEELSLLANRRLIDAALGAERMLLERFDLVSTISPRMIEALERKGAPPERLMLFPNWVETEHIRPLPSPVPLRRELGIEDDRCVVLYAGSMGRKQGLESVIEAARMLGGTDRPPLFVLAGRGATRGEIEAAAAGLPHVRFLPIQDEARFNEFLNLGDIHLLPQRRGVADLVMPSKLGAMLAAGKPVIATVPPGSQVAQTLEGVGVVVPPEDAAALASAIAALAGDRPRRAALGAAARAQACRLWQEDAILSAVERRLLALCGGEPRRAAAQ